MWGVGVQKIVIFESSYILRFDILVISNYIVLFLHEGGFHICILREKLPCEKTSFYSGEYL